MKMRYAICSVLTLFASVSYSQPCTGGSFLVSFSTALLSPEELIVALGSAQGEWAERDGNPRISGTSVLLVASAVNRTGQPMATDAVAALAEQELRERLSGIPSAIVECNAVLTPF